MARDLLTPLFGGVTRDLANGLVFRKQILPAKPIQYEGRTLTFDQPYLQDLVTAFNDAAYDQVPFVLADQTNAHTMDPERMRGEVTSVSLAEPDEPPGLYATIAFPTPQAAKAVLDNPKLGVSCRIKEGVAKADGRAFSKALVHVCGTLDPRVTGMSPWRKVDLSEYEQRDELIDLSTKEYSEDSTMAPKNGTTGGTATDEAIDFSTWTDAELTQLAEALDVDVESVLGLRDTPKDEAPKDETKDEAPKGELVGAGAGKADLSSPDGGNIDLAVAAAERANEALRQLADQQWATERNALLLQGIPPAAIDLSAKYLSQPGGFTVDLSNGSGSDTPADVAGDFRQMLGMLSGYVDLAVETGHGGQFQQNTDADPDAPLLAQWDQQFGN